MRILEREIADGVTLMVDAQNGTEAGTCLAFVVRAGIPDKDGSPQEQWSTITAHEAMVLLSGDWSAAWSEPAPKTPEVARSSWAGSTVRQSATLADARTAVERLIHFIREHAQAVKGGARAELNEEAAVVERWRAWLSERSELRGATEAELVQMLCEIASAGYQSLQILGGYLARNEEEWG